MAAIKPKQPKTYKSVDLKIVAGPHNGLPPYQSPDPVTGAAVGGQVAFIRACLRYKRVVAPWGRRAGKSTTRPFLWAEEAQMTAGRYTAGYLSANHVKAHEMWLFSKLQFGELVVDAVGEPESQNRYIDLAPINGDPKKPIPRAYAQCPIISKRISENAGKNTGSRIYFWSGQHPHYNAIQGFPFRFDRISADEAQMLNSGVTRIINPMLLDSGGALDVSGIADFDSPGNDWFSDYYERASDPEKKHRWFSLNFPTYCNPNLDAEAMKEIEDDLLTTEDYEQFVWARFISASGAVFKNLAAIFTVTPKWSRTAPAHKDLPAWALALLLRAPSDSLMAWIVEDGPVTGHTYAMTVDFAGRTKNRDATVISVFDMTENKQVALISIRDMPSPDQLHWIEGVKDRYGANELYGDETPEGAALMGYLRERYKTGVIGVKFSASNKAEYVKRGQFLFEMSEVRLINCPYQYKEFKDFRRIASESKDGRDGPVTYSHPPNKHDDSVCAFLQIAPAMAYGRRSMEQPDTLPPPLIADDGALNLDPMNFDLVEDLAESEENVSVRVPRA